MLSRARYRFSRANGGSWEIPQALPGVRRSGSTYCPCRERNQLLRALPNRRKITGRSIAVAASQAGLAADLGRARGGPQVANGVKPDGFFCVENSVPFLREAGGDG